MRKYRKPYRVKKKKLILKSRFFWLGILILLIFGGFFYLICFSSFFQIKEIRISGNQKVLTENLESLIREKIGQEVLLGALWEGGGWVASSESIFLTNLSKINKAILEKFPQIAKINLKRNFPDALIIEIEERKPVAIFCQNENCFFIDNEGVIFEEAVDIKPQQLIIHNLTLLKESKLGERVVEKELLLQILEIESKIKKDLKIQLSEISIVSDERVNIKTLEDWQIYLNPKEDIDWQLTKLKAVLEEEIPLERRKDLKYIELRFGNFAPYKYR